MSLRERDYRAILSVIDELETADDRPAFMRDTARLVHDLVPADQAVFSETDPMRRVELNGAQWPGSEMTAEEEEIFWTYSHQHPLCDAVAHDGAPHVRRMSDMISTRDLRELDLYRESMHPAGVEFEMMLQLPWVVGMCRMIELSRTERDFSERDVEMLTLLQPHLTHAYRNLRDHERLEMALGAIDSTAAASGFGVAILGADGRIVEFSDGVPSQLAFFFDVETATVPDVLDAWIRDERERPHRDPSDTPWRPFVVERGGRQLRVRLIRATGHTQLLFEEPTARVPEVDASLALTKREIEVLRLIAEGLTNREAARRLSVSDHTIRTHLEHVFTKLGVGTRTAAVAKAFGDRVGH
jgi:DNA-binding CsgD family transcriptional regulator